MEARRDSCLPPLSPSHRRFSKTASGLLGLGHLLETYSEKNTKNRLKTLIIFVAVQSFVSFQPLKYQQNTEIGNKIANFQEGTEMPLLDAES